MALLITELEKAFVRDVYEKIAEDFSVTRVSIWDGVAQFLDRIPSGSTVIDLGCGNGKNIKRQDLEWYAVDQSKGFLNICENKFKDWENPPVIKEGNIMEIPLDNKIADYLICVATFHHLSTVEHRLMCLKEIKRVLKGGGKGLITVWAREFEKGFAWEKQVEKQGGGQDILIPWKGTQQKGGVQPRKEYRYYHFFKKPEIIKYIETYFIIEKIWFENNNWFVEFTV